ncbi:MAG TPA: hypothetical protein VK791_04170 [bacterium]|nr:hypothetical protein [bacterium]
MSETKTDYIKRQKGNLDSWTDEIAKYQVKADKASEKMVEKYKKQIVDLKEKHAGLEMKIADVEKSAEEGWEAIKIASDKAFKDLDKSFKVAKAFFN